MEFIRLEVYVLLRRSISMPSVISFHIFFLHVYYQKCIDFNLIFLADEVEQGLTSHQTCYRL